MNDYQNYFQFEVKFLTHNFIDIYNKCQFITDLEIKLVTLVIKSDIHLQSKLGQVSKSMQDLLFKLNNDKNSKKLSWVHTSK